jgi:tetratricopeptide (TPR) repeat protein
VCWIAACLADALSFAHGRGLVHLDVKPSNVLLTADGLPMLLDFHLARAPLAAGALPPPWLGGTPGYLSPEQRAALEAVRAGCVLPQAVDGRTDLYSLGTVLFEALAGQCPNPVWPAGQARRALRQLNPRTSPALTDLVVRCLAPAPRDRYPSAAALADDLRRHLADLPLRGVRNRSLAERFRKWRRRRPHALGALGLLLGLLCAALLAAGYTSHRLRQARDALDDGNLELKKGQFATASAAYQRGQAVVGGLPVGAGLARELAEGLRRARGGEAVAQLHAAAERLRALEGGEGPAGHHVRLFWEKREEITALLGPLPQAARRQALDDLIEVGLLWAHLQGRGRVADALPILEQLEQAVGRCAAIDHERARYLRALGRPDEAKEAQRRADSAPPRSAWEHYALGCCHLRAGDLTAARAQLERAAELEPSSFWAHFYKGRCELQLGRPQEALVAFSVCVALEPQRPLGYTHRGLAHSRLRQPEAARRDAATARRLQSEARGGE